MIIELCSKLKGFIHKWKIGKMEKHAHKEIWEEDYELIENEGLFEEYLEMGQLLHHFKINLCLEYFEFFFYFFCILSRDRKRVLLYR